MANTYQGSVSTKYLNLTGLESFWSKVKEYVDNQDQTVNNRLTELYNAVLGDGGNVEVEGSSLGERLVSLEQGLDTIQSSYVADVNAENSNTGTKYVTVSVTDDTDTSEQSNGKQTKITIDDSALTETISNIENNYAKTSDLPTTLPNPSKLKVTNANGNVVEYDGSSVVEVDSISHSNTSNNSDKLDGHDSTYFATATSITGLGERLTAVEGYVQDVNAENSNTGTKYVTVSVTDDTNTGSNGKQTKITIDDSALTEKIASLDAISHVNSIDGQSGVVTVDKNATDPWSVNFEVGDDKKLTGEVVAPDHLGIEDIQTSVSAGVDGYLTLTENEVDGVSTITLGGTLDETIDILKGYVQDVEAENPNTGTKYVTVSVTDDTNTNTGSDGKQTKITIDDSALTEKISDIENNIEDNYTKTEDLPKKLPNPHKFTLTYRDKENQEKVVEYDGSSAKDVDFSLYHATTSTTATRVSNPLKVVDANGNAYDYNGGVMVDLSDGINYAAEAGNADTLDNHDSTYFAVASTVNGQIQDILDTIAGLGQVVELKGVLSSLPTTTEGYGNGDVVIVGNKEYICYNSLWYLLGDTTELSQDVSTIKSSYVKSIQATGTGVTVSPTTPSVGDVTIEIDATPITDAISELEASFGNYYTKTQVNTELAKYLLLSGGTMSGPISGLTNLTSAGNITATEYGFRLSSTQYDGYIWNTVAGKGISIGLIDNGSTSPQYASLNIKGSNLYPGTTQKYGLGTPDNEWNYIYSKNIVASNNISAPKFVTTGGTASQVVLGDGTLKAISDISTGGEANVQSDWNVTDTTSDAYIKNKPTSLKNPYSLTIQKNGTDVATYDGSETKTANITVALSDVPHTHTVPKTGTTALEASKSDHSHTASSGGPSVSYSATTGVLTITMNHTHTVPADTENIISVASQEHTHTTGQAQ